METRPSLKYPLRALTISLITGVFVFTQAVPYSYAESRSRATIERSQNRMDRVRPYTEDLGVGMNAHMRQLSRDHSQRRIYSRNRNPLTRTVGFPNMGQGERVLRRDTRASLDRSGVNEAGGVANGGSGSYSDGYKVENVELTDYLEALLQESLQDEVDSLKQSSHLEEVLLYRYGAFSYDSSMDDSMSYVVAISPWVIPKHYSSIPIYKIGGIIQIESWHDEMLEDGSLEHYSSYDHQTSFAYVDNKGNEIGSESHLKNIYAHYEQKMSEIYRTVFNREEVPEILSFPESESEVYFNFDDEEVVNSIYSQKMALSLLKEVYEEMLSTIDLTLSHLPSSGDLGPDDEQGFISHANHGQWDDIYEYSPELIKKQLSSLYSQLLLKIQNSPIIEPLPSVEELGVEATLSLKEIIQSFPEWLDEAPKIGGSLLSVYLINQLRENKKAKNKYLKQTRSFDLEVESLTQKLQQKAEEAKSSLENYFDELVQYSHLEESSMVQLKADYESEIDRVVEDEIDSVKSLKSNEVRLFDDYESLVKGLIGSLLEGELLSLSELSQFPEPNTPEITDSTAMSDIDQLLSDIEDIFHIEKERDSLLKEILFRENANDNKKKDFVYELELKKGEKSSAIEALSNQAVESKNEISLLVDGLVAVGAMTISEAASFQVLYQNNIEQITQVAISKINEVVFIDESNIFDAYSSALSQQRNAVIHSKSLSELKSIILPELPQISSLSEIPLIDLDLQKIRQEVISATAQISLDDRREVMLKRIDDQKVLSQQNEQGYINALVQLESIRTQRINELNLAGSLAKQEVEKILKEVVEIVFLSREWKDEFKRSYDASIDKVVEESIETLNAVDLNADLTSFDDYERLLSQLIEEINSTTSLEEILIPEHSEIPEIPVLPVANIQVQIDSLLSDAEGAFSFLDHMQFVEMTPDGRHMVVTWAQPEGVKTPLGYMAKNGLLTYDIEEDRVIKVTDLEGPILAIDLSVEGSIKVQRPVENEEEIDASFSYDGYGISGFCDIGDCNPNDILRDAQGSYFNDQVSAETFWQLAAGRGTTVAVIDTGVNYDHPELVNQMWVNENEIPGNGIDDDQNGYVDDYYGWDFWNNDNDPNDGHFHGTHVAGIIAAQGNNETGIVGVAPLADIMALKACGDNGACNMSNVVDAIYYAANNGADVINLSLGGLYKYLATKYSGYRGEGIEFNRSLNMHDVIGALQIAINYAEAKGVTVIAAAGNSAMPVANIERFILQWEETDFIPGGSGGGYDEEVITTTYVKKWELLLPPEDCKKGDEGCSCFHDGDGGEICKRFGHWVDKPVQTIEYRWVDEYSDEDTEEETIYEMFRFNAVVPAIFATHFVMAIDEGGRLANFSNTYGADFGVFENTNSSAVFASGVQILSLGLGEAYKIASGTSMASPVYAGVVALEKSLEKFMDGMHDEIIHIVREMEEENIKRIGGNELGNEEKDNLLQMYRSHFNALIELIRNGATQAQFIEKAAIVDFFRSKLGIHDTEVPEFLERYHSFKNVMGGIGRQSNLVHDIFNLGNVASELLAHPFMEVVTGILQDRFEAATSSLGLIKDALLKNVHFTLDAVRGTIEFLKEKVDSLIGDFSPDSLIFIQDLIEQEDLETAEYLQVDDKYFGNHELAESDNKTEWEVIKIRMTTSDFVWNARIEKDAMSEEVRGIVQKWEGAENELTTDEKIAELTGRKVQFQEKINDWILEVNALADIKKTDSINELNELRNQFDDEIDGYISFEENKRVWDYVEKLASGVEQLGFVEPDFRVFDTLQDVDQAIEVLNSEKDEHLVRISAALAELSGVSELEEWELSDYMKRIEDRKTSLIGEYGALLVDLQNLRNQMIE